MAFRKGDKVKIVKSSYRWTKGTITKIDSYGNVEITTKTNKKIYTHTDYVEKR